MQLSARASRQLAHTLRLTALSRLAKALALQFPTSRVYLVGGYLRDLIMGHDSKDIDLVVSGVTARNLERFLRRVGTVNLVGRTFGVFKFIPKHKTVPAIDIALPRRERAFGTGGYRDVAVQSDWKLPIEEDLSRRDFTMNALAWDLLTHKLIDPFGGERDIHARRVRAVGKAEVRFKEDYSRMLRALRFACQLDFTVEPKTWRALAASITRINATRAGERVVPYEIIAKELLKAFCANPPCAFDLFDTSGATKVLMPELIPMKRCPQPRAYHREGDVWTHTRLALAVLAGSRFAKEFGSAPNAEVVMAVLFHDIGKPRTIVMPKARGERIRFDGHDKIGAQMACRISERLRLSSYKDERIDVDAERLAWLVGHHLLLISGDPRAMRATTIERHYLRDRRLGDALLALQFADGSATIGANGASALREYRAMRKRIATLLGTRRLTLPPPLLNGHDIMRVVHLQPGPEVGQALHRLREAQLSGKVKTRHEALTFIKRV
ncbi:CCA tRNA nucleotidyltransferase [Candidatus Uhrbacteria bacterium]|nr:CCA tRNA nucleotidyltransferase [Candidatus Uhrbacteria bacterium]